MPPPRKCLVPSLKHGLVLQSEPWNRMFTSTSVSQRVGLNRRSLRGAGDIAGIAAGGGYVWLSHTDDTLTRIDINTGAARLTEPANALASFKAH